MLDEDSDWSKSGYTMKFRWLFGIWTCLARMMLENPPLLNQQCTHKCAGNHCPLVVGRVCTAQTVFSCSPEILNIRTVGTAGMHNFDRSFQEFLHHLIWSHFLITIYWFRLQLLCWRNSGAVSGLLQGARALGCARTCGCARVCARVAVPAWQYVGAAPQVGARPRPCPPPQHQPPGGVYNIPYIYHVYTIYIPCIYMVYTWYIHKIYYTYELYIHSIYWGYTM